MEFQQEEIRKLVFTFYKKVRKNDDIGPIFNERIAEDHWPPHLEKMCRFWGSMLGTGEQFAGNPMQAHLPMDEVQPQNFQSWLTLFDETCHEIFDDERAAFVLGKAQMVANSLQMGMGLDRGKRGLKNPFGPLRF